MARPLKKMRLPLTTDNVIFSYKQLLEKLKVKVDYAWMSNHGATITRSAEVNSLDYLSIFLRFFFTAKENLWKIFSVCSKRRYNVCNYFNFLTEN